MPADQKLTAFPEPESAIRLACPFRELKNFGWNVVLGLASGHVVLSYFADNFGDAPAGLIREFSKLHHRRLMERVQWTAI